MASQLFASLLLIVLVSLDLAIYIYFFFQWLCFSLVCFPGFCNAGFSWFLHLLVCLYFFLFLGSVSVCLACSCLHFCTGLGMIWCWGVLVLIVFRSYPEESKTAAVLIERLTVTLQYRLTILGVTAEQQPLY